VCEAARDDGADGDRSEPGTPVEATADGGADSFGVGSGRGAGSGVLVPARIGAAVSAANRVGAVFAGRDRLARAGGERRRVPGDGTAGGADSGVADDQGGYRWGGEVGYGRSGRRKQRAIVGAVGTGAGASVAELPAAGGNGFVDGEPAKDPRVGPGIRSERD